MWIQCECFEICWKRLAEWDIVVITDVCLTLRFSQKSKDKTERCCKDQYKPKRTPQYRCMIPLASCLLCDNTRPRVRQHTQDCIQNSIGIWFPNSVPILPLDNFKLVCIPRILPKNNFAILSLSTYFHTKALRSGSSCFVMAYGTAYVGMAPKKMAATLKVHDTLEMSTLD